MKTLRELKDFSTKFVLKPRLTKERIEKEFSEFLGFPIDFNRSDYEDSSDYSYILTLDLGDRLLYFDFYFLLDRHDYICITEFSFDSDYALYETDLDKKIIGVEQ